MKSNQGKWDEDYLALAAYWANRKSKDPRTRVGAIVVSPANSIVGIGYNGFPKGVTDSPDRYADRETKYAFVVHAEANALIGAGKEAQGATLYTTHPPCQECTKTAIQAGIAKIVCSRSNLGMEAWEKSRVNSEKMLTEAGVEYESI